jgi:hypothetical protein
MSVEMTQTSLLIDAQVATHYNFSSLSSCTTTLCWVFPELFAVTVKLYAIVRIEGESTEDYGQGNKIQSEATSFKLWQVCVGEESGFGPLDSAVMAVNHYMCQDTRPNEYRLIWDAGENASGLNCSMRLGELINNFIVHGLCCMHLILSCLELVWATAGTPHIATSNSQPRSDPRLDLHYETHRRSH